MRSDKVEELGKRIIHDVCQIGMTAEEVVTTFDLVADALCASLLYEKLTDMLGRGAVSEAEEILKEAIEDVDQ